MTRRSRLGWPPEPTHAGRSSSAGTSRVQASTTTRRASTTGIDWPTTSVPFSCMTGRSGAVESARRCSTVVTSLAPQLPTPFESSPRSSERIDSATASWWLRWATDLSVIVFASFGIGSEQRRAASLQRSTGRATRMTGSTGGRSSDAGEWAGRCAGLASTPAPVTPTAGSGQRSTRSVGWRSRSVSTLCSSSTYSPSGRLTRRR